MFKASPQPSSTYSKSVVSARRKKASKKYTHPITGELITLEDLAYELGVHPKTVKDYFKKKDSENPPQQIPNNNWSEVEDQLLIAAYGIPYLFQEWERYTTIGLVPHRTKHAIKNRIKLLKAKGKLVGNRKELLANSGWLTTENLSQYLGVSRDTVVRWVDDCNLKEKPKSFITKTRYVHIKDFLNWTLSEDGIVNFSSCMVSPISCSWYLAQLRAWLKDLIYNA